MAHIPPSHEEGRAGVWLNRLATAAALAGSVLLAVHAIDRHVAPGRQAETDATGELRVVGSHVMEQPVRRWIGMFSREYPRVTIHAALYGSGTAANEMAEGRADVVPLARPLNADERSMLSRAARLPIAVRIGSVAGSAPDPMHAARSRDKSAGCRPVFIYIRSSAPAPTRRLALAFVAVALSGDGQAAIADGQFSPLTATARRRAVVRLEALARRSDGSDADGSNDLTRGEDQQCI